MWIDVHINECKKAEAYTRVSGDTHIESSKNHKQAILPVITSPDDSVLLNNYSS